MMLVEAYQQVNISESNVTSYELWKKYISPDFMSIIPEHWLQFPPPNRRIHYLLGVIYMLILIPGIGANSLIIWLFFKIKSLRTPSNFLVLNLAISDLLMNSKMPLFVYNSFSLGPATGLWGCQLYGFIGGLSGTSAILTISAMALERYKIISNPLDANIKLTNSKAFKILIFIWIYVLNFSIPPLFGLNRYVPEGYLTSCSFDYLDEKWLHRGFVIVFFVAAWCVPIIIICWCYIGIVIKVRNHERTFTQQECRMRIKHKIIKKCSSEVKLAKIAFCLISLWFLAWTPYAIVALIGTFFDRKLLTPLMSMVPALFCKSASVIDPFVYGLTHPKFKIEVYRLLNKIFPCVKIKKRSRSTFRSTKSLESISSDNIEMDYIPQHSPVESIKSVSSENKIEVNKVEVFVIPQVYDIITKNEKIKIKCRRSI